VEPHFEKEVVLVNGEREKSKQVLADNFEPNVWLVKPGIRAEMWRDCIEKGVICVGWEDAASSLEKLLECDRNEFDRFYSEIYNDRPDQLWCFLRDVRVGDILLAVERKKEGNSFTARVIGAGVIKSGPFYSEEFRHYPLCREVNWIKTDLNLESPDRSNFTIKKLELSRISDPKLRDLIFYLSRKKKENSKIKMKNIIDKIQVNKKQLILYGPPGTGKTWLARNFAKEVGQEKYRFRRKTISGVGFFLWVINPNEWDYTLLEENEDVDIIEKQGSRLKSAFEKIQQGDLVFIYVGGNVKKIYGIGRYKESKNDEMKNVIRHYITVLKLIDGPSYSDLKTMLKDSSPIRQNLRGTLFSLESEEGSRLLKELRDKSRLNLSELGIEVDEEHEDLECIRFVTFHPSYSYEEFVEGLRPKADKEGNIKYEIEDGIFKKICKDAFNALMNHAGIDEVWEDELPELSKDEKQIVVDSLENAPKFFLVIDEINRGDISRIFGELITLLEADKRLFAENELTVILPYSKEKFGVPPNLYIIGTMNTADRSIALIDVALRRRFGFIELMPDYEVLEDKLLSSDDEARDVKELAIDVLRKLNERIRKNYDRDHQIGHSYLLKLKEAKTGDEAIQSLQFIWYHEILPLLQEYFYDSPEKLKRVLNDAFVRVEENSFDFEYLEGERFVEELRKVSEQEQQ